MLLVLTIAVGMLARGVVARYDRKSGSSRVTAVASHP